MWVNNLSIIPLIFRLNNFQKSQSSKRSNCQWYFKKLNQKARCHYLIQPRMHISEEVDSLLNPWLGLLNIEWFLIAQFLRVFFALLEFQMLALIHISLLFELLISLDLPLYIFSLVPILISTHFSFLFYFNCFFLHFLNFVGFIESLLQFFIGW